jgi:hypothetical protein
MEISDNHWMEGDASNPKLEIRNPKQSQMIKAEMTKTLPRRAS